MKQRWARQAAAAARAEAAAGQTAEARAGEGEREEGGAKRPGRKPLDVPALEDEQAACEAWFVCRTHEEVIEAFRRELVALSRRYGQRQEIARIETLVERILTTFDAIDDELLQAEWADKVDAPLAFEAGLKAERAARMRGSG